MTVAVLRHLQNDYRSGFVRAILVVITTDFLLIIIATSELNYHGGLMTRNHGWFMSLLQRFLNQVV